MPAIKNGHLEPLFHPESVALVGITVANPEHWTRTFLHSLLQFEFDGPMYLVNRRGGEIEGRKVYRKLQEVPDTVDYVIGTVPARGAPALVEECAGKGVKAIHFCTAGFSETGDKEATELEAELVEVSRKNGIRIIGPNCMGIYCPQSRLSFDSDFPRESGSVGFVSQSGGNAITLVREAMLRGVRFSKVVSYGNACDLNESDFVEYLAADPDTEVIALYVEGVKDGRRFRQALEKAASKKAVVLLKGGVTKGGKGAAAGHTGALAGDEATWDSLCKQLGIIQVSSLEQLVDTLVTLLFMPVPRGRNVALLGAGGGASVLIADEFEKRKLTVPALPPEIRNLLLDSIRAEGNILRNPVDYSQAMMEIDKVVETVSIIAQWEVIDLLIGFFRPSQFTQGATGLLSQIAERMAKAGRAASKPMAMVLIPSVLPEEARDGFPAIQQMVSLRLPVYFSFAGAADAISLVLSYYEGRSGNRSAKMQNPL